MVGKSLQRLHDNFQQVEVEVEVEVDHPHHPPCTVYGCVNCLSSGHRFSFPVS